MSRTKQFVVIGLGVFGKSVAEFLDAKGYDVLAIDTDLDLVDSISEHVTKAVQADSTKIEDLQDLGVADFDCAVVAMGTNLEASMLTVLNLKELEVNEIVAKAKSSAAEKILLKIGATSVVIPEKEMGLKVARTLMPNKIVDLMEIDNEYTVAEIKCPPQWVGYTLKTLNVRQAFKTNVIGIRRKNMNLEVMIDPDYVIQETDQFLVVCKKEVIEQYQ